MAGGTNYFKLGVFLLAGCALLLAGVAVLGVGLLHKDTVPAETYFDESVQGLDVGAPVKYRGVQIGRVSKITFITDRYPAREQLARLVLVDMELDARIVRRLFFLDDLQGQLNPVIESGLRVRLTTQGLTGVGFLEINFVDPVLNPVLALHWQPESIYLPSAPSTMSRLEGALDSIGSVMRQVEAIDFEKFSLTVRDFLERLTIALKDADVTTLGQLLAQNLQESRDALRRINTLLADKSADAILPDAAAAINGTRRIVESNEARVEKLMTAFTAAAESLRKTSASLETLLASPALRQSADALPATLGNVAEASQDVKQSAVQLERLLASLNELVRTQRVTLEAILEDTRSVMTNLEHLTGDAAQNPSRLLFGAPPPRFDPKTVVPPALQGQERK